MSTVISLKSSDFLCEICSTNPGNKKDYNKHLLTRKHIKNSLAAQTQQDDAKHIYKCDVCNKEYTCRSGLWRHKKICNENIIEPTTTHISEIKILTNLLLAVVKNNQDLQKQMIEMCETINKNK